MCQGFQQCKNALLHQNPDLKWYSRKIFCAESAGRQPNLWGESTGTEQNKILDVKHPKQISFNAPSWCTLLILSCFTATPDWRHPCSWGPEVEVGVEVEAEADVKVDIEMEEK